MNRFTVSMLVLVGISAGCAGPNNRSQQSQPLTQEQFDQARYPAAAATMAADLFEPAAALVFDLPVARGNPPINLDRASREPSAFVGYEDASVEYHTVLIYNSQGTGYGDCGFGDGYQRQDFIQRTSVRYR